MFIINWNTIMTPFLGTLLWNIVIALWIFLFVFLLHPLKNKILHKLDYITATTVWLMLWIIFLWFFPEIIHLSEWRESHIWGYILLWLWIFYILELFFHWHHCKDLEIECHDHHHHHEHSIEDSHKKDHKNSYLMFSGTFFHNVFHGVELFSAFAIDIKLWIGMTIAIFLHAIPQNIAHFVMNQKNVKYVYLAWAGWIFWALLTYPFSDFLLAHTFEILSIIVGWLIYISLTDIFPSFKEKGTTKHKIIYLFFMIMWTVSFFFFNSFVESIATH